MSTGVCFEADEKSLRRGAWPSEKGFTSVEMAVCVLIIGIVIGSALLTANTLLPTMHADSSLDLVVTQLRQARTQAMDERRNFVVTFTGTNEVTVQRQELPLSNPTYTLIADNFLGQGMFYTVLPVAGDTPDGFDPSLTPISVGGGTSITFQGDGTAVNTTTGQQVNATVFMATSGETITARAVTVMGATGQIQGYRYNGSKWTTQ
jgi:Tfp pilus assembly protein FimT